VRVLYTDLDGTMLGRRGSFFADATGAPTPAPAEALLRLRAAGVALVLVSGRTRAQLLEAGALLGADGYIAELGALVGWDLGRRQAVLPSAAPDGAPGAPEELLAELFGAFDLDYHRPWHLGHEVDALLEGYVDAAAVDAWLADRGYGWLRLRDNGRLSRPGRDSPLHVYHLLPDGISKGAAVAFDLARRGLTPQDAVAVGDSASDLEMAAAVGRMYLVANGAAVPAVAERLPQLPNVQVTEAAMSLGWAEAVSDALGGA
jgi:phosphoglycolate phosphatase